MGEDLARVIDEYTFDHFENALQRAQNVTRAPCAGRVHLTKRSCLSSSQAILYRISFN